jgi:hypothetical protein
VITIGDSWMDYIGGGGGIQAGLDRAGTNYRHYAVSGTTLLTGQIPGQYTQAKRANPKILTAIMTGVATTSCFRGRATRRKPAKPQSKRSDRRRMGRALDANGGGRRERRDPDPVLGGRRHGAHEYAPENGRTSTDLLEWQNQLPLPCDDGSRDGEPRGRYSSPRRRPTIVSRRLSWHLMEQRKIRR